MRINIKTTNFSLTPAIKDYLKEKLNSLKKFLPNDENILADVELGQTTRHHQKGDIFRAEVNLIIPGRLIRVISEKWDLKVAIDCIKDELQRKIKDNKEKNISIYKRGARLLKKLLKGE